MKFSHNSYWCNNPIQDAIDVGLEAVEFDIVYSLFRNEIFVNHSWRPLESMYYDKFKYAISEMSLYNIKKQNIKYLIIESKSFWIPQKKLYLILKHFLTIDSGVKIVMSVQSKYPHQWIRGLWLKSFYKKYKDKLGILDKRTEKVYDGTYLNEQVDLFPKYNRWQRLLYGQF